MAKSGREPQLAPGLDILSSSHIIKVGLRDFEAFRETTDEATWSMWASCPLPKTSVTLKSSISLRRVFEPRCHELLVTHGFSFKLQELSDVVEPRLFSLSELRGMTQLLPELIGLEVQVPSHDHPAAVLLHHLPGQESLEIQLRTDLRTRKLGPHGAGAHPSASHHRPRPKPS